MRCFEDCALVVEELRGGVVARFDQWGEEIEWQVRVLVVYDEEG